MNRLYTGDYDISVVVPCFNEELNVRPLRDKICEVVDKITESYEMVFVDDGSSDGTFEALSKLNDEDHRVKVVRLRRNFGQTAALAAGLDHARGGVVIAMDGDLQYDPKDIPALLAKIDEGYDIASGWRTNRKSDNFITRRLPSLIANRLMAKVCGVNLHDFGSTFKAYRGDILPEIKLYGEMHRFVPALASAVGAKIAEVPVELLPRQHGVSKYGLGRTWRVALDIILVKFFVSYSKQPLRLFGLMGMLMGGAGFLVLLALSIMRLFGDPFANHQPLVQLSILLVLLGVQFISLGLVAELITRTYHETQGKPIYSVRQTVGELNNEDDRRKATAQTAGSA